MKSNSWLQSWESLPYWARSQTIKMITLDVQRSHLFILLDTSDNAHTSCVHVCVCLSVCLSPAKSFCKIVNTKERWFRATTYQTETANLAPKRLSGRQWQLSRIDDFFFFLKKKALHFNANLSYLLFVSPFLSLLTKTTAATKIFHCHRLFDSSEESCWDCFKDLLWCVGGDNCIIPEWANNITDICQLSEHHFFFFYMVAICVH